MIAVVSSQDHYHRGHRHTSSKRFFHQLLPHLSRTYTKICKNRQLGIYLLKHYMTTSKIKYQIVLPHNHRQDYAKNAINSFKDHFIAGLTSMNKFFPLKLWCRLLPHAQDSLNLLCQSRVNPHLSAYADLNGAFDYNATPMLQPGLKVIIHEKKTTKKIMGSKMCWWMVFRTDEKNTIGAIEYIAHAQTQKESQTQYTSSPITLHHPM